MKQKNLYLMCGVPASGKSTYCKKVLESHDRTVHISRDNIRFSITSPYEEYFAHEDEVFDKFIEVINQAIENPDITNILIDATHINEKSRNKTLDRLNLENVNLYAVNFETPLATCLIRNNDRVGRERVPAAVIRRMYYQFKKAKAGEKYNYDNIYNEKG